MPHSTRRSWPRLIALVVGLGTVVVGSSSLVLSDEETVPKRSSRSSKSSSGGASADVGQELEENLPNPKKTEKKSLNISSLALEGERVVSASFSPTMKN